MPAWCQTVTWLLPHLFAAQLCRTDGCSGDCWVSAVHSWAAEKSPAVLVLAPCTACSCWTYTQRPETAVALRRITIRTECTTYCMGAEFFQYPEAVLVPAACTPCRPVGSGRWPSSHSSRTAAAPQDGSSRHTPGQGPAGAGCPAAAAGNTHTRSQQQQPSLRAVYLGAAWVLAR